MAVAPYDLTTTMGTLRGAAALWDESTRAGPASPPELLWLRVVLLAVVRCRACAYACARRLLLLLTPLLVFIMELYSYMVIAGGGGL